MLVDFGGEMKKVLSLILSILMVVGILGQTLEVLGLNSQSSIPVTFSDVAKGEYYEDAVYWAVDNNITKGTSDTTFGPYELCTRGQAITFIWRIAGEPTPSAINNPFTDVKTQDYFYNAVLWAVEKGITSGTSNTTFSPEECLTRQQFVTLLWRYAGEPKSNAYNPFEDVTKDDYSYKAVLWAVSNGITKGTSDTTFGKEENCVRAQTITFLYRHSLTKSKAVTTKKDIPVSKLTIESNDISNYVIVFDNDNSVMIKAANQLSKYIKDATGVELVVSDDVAGHQHNRIYVKNEKVLSDDEGFSYYSDDNGIIIKGSSVRGILYGVYQFLEREIGWRYYTDTFEVCLESDEINLTDLQYSYKPYFKFRNTFWYESLLPYEDASEFAPKRMLNEGFARQTTEENGGTVGFVLDRQAHSIFALSGIGAGDSANPCLTDDDIYDEVRKNVKALLYMDRSRKIISISQNDNDDHCQCANCKALEDQYGPAGPWICFINRLSADLEDEFPDVTFQTLAYQYTRSCPTGLVCNDNVMIELCPIDICHNHAIDDPTCEVNVEFVKDFEAWSKICKQMYIWEYTTNFQYNLCPYPNFDVILSTERYYYENNVIGVFSQGNGGQITGEFGALRSYLVAKCLENPYMTDEEYYAMMDEFLQNFYGSSWELVREYIDFITELSDTNNDHFCCFDAPEKIYGEKPFGKYNDYLVSLWDKAEEIADNDFYLENVQRTRLGADFLRLGAIFKEWKEAKGTKKEYVLEQIELLYDNIERLGAPLSDKQVSLPARNSAIKQNPRRWVPSYIWPYSE